MIVLRRAVLAAALATAIAPATALGHHDRHGEAHHSLREAVTDQNFYFVMADRFNNGDPANDHGGLPPGKNEGQSGFDPTGKGWYHGGDLKGLTAKLDYIQGLGTTAIWLTPSFKNKAVQPEDFSAGYHGYWITDFTQIDPHFGTNDDLRTLIDAAHRRGIKVYFDIITNHTADVIKYGKGLRQPYKSKDQAPYKTASGQPFDDRDYAGGRTFPKLAPTGQPDCNPLAPLISFAVPPVRAAVRAQHQGPGVAQRRPLLPQPRRHDVRRRELAVRRLLRARRPVHRGSASSSTASSTSTSSGSATSASTASGWTRCATSTTSSGRSSRPRSSTTRARAASATSTCSARRPRTSASRCCRAS